MTLAEREIARVEAAGRVLEFHPVDESPCRRACPAGIDVKRYVGQIAAEDFPSALATIRKRMPFPSVCGRICLHPCETECARGEVDEPIAIMHLKRFVSEYEMREGETEPLPPRAEPTGKRIAIVGSGPAGLTAAHDLALRGHEVKVFERAREPGGLMTQAIPEFELPAASVRRDIERMEQIGVEIECNHAIDGKEGVRKLLKDRYSAVLLATGSAGRWRGLRGPSWVPGGDADGVIGAVEFMRRFHGGDSDGAGRSLGRTVVLGWGIHALACARTAVRLGCPGVLWIIPLERDQLQPDARLVREAEEEGVEIIGLTRPLAIETSNGHAIGVRCVGLELGEPDHVWRRECIEKPGAEKTISCGTVIDAAYFAPDTVWDALAAGPWGTVQVDLDTMVTSIDGVFAAGDVVSGPKSVVEAVALGHRAAEGINRYLAGDPKRIGTLSSPIRVPGWEIDDPARTPSRAYRPSVRPVKERKGDFSEAERSFTIWEATHEARRCLMCGPCEECAVCISDCLRKRGTAEIEPGARLFVRVPLPIARFLHEELETAPEGGLELFVARIDPNRCRGCGVCEEICEYHAPRVAPDSTGAFKATIDILACKGCGTCIAACPSGAIDQGMSSLHAIHEAVWGGAK